jgi:hypothetical protein
MRIVNAPHRKDEDRDPSCHRWNGELLPDRPALKQKLGAVAAQADPEDACGIPTGISG